MLLRSLAFSLAREGYFVRSCPDGNSAWKTFLEEPAWDLLVTDQEMPGMDGLELARNLRSRDSRLPILLLTGHDPEDLPPKENLPDRCQILTKPCRLEILLRTMAQILSNR